MNHPPVKVQTQDPRKFTVQIRDANGVIVGTGFVVSENGQIVTCYHVVRDASGQVAEGIQVAVYFPKARNQEMKANTATITACFHDYDDDVVLLQLDTSLPYGVEAAILGKAEDSTSHKFRSYGYRRLGEYQGLQADGKILGLIEPPSDRNLQSDPVMLKSQNIDSGMSGAAVLDTQRDLVVGVIAQTWYSGESEKDRDTGFGVDCVVLTFEPMHLSLAEMPLAQLPTPQHTINLDATGGQPVSQPGIVLDNAPAPIPEWVGRVDFLRTLNQDWLDPNCLIVGIIGFGGEGKSSLTRRWLKELLENSSLPQPTGVFWWGFYEKGSVDEFFTAALKFLVANIDTEKLTTAEKAKFINATLTKGRYLFILDGLEVLQHEKGDDYGEFTDSELRDFLRGFASGGHESFCLINSRAIFLDLIDFTTYTHRDLERLSAEEGRDLLRKVGVKGVDSDLDKVVADWDGYALVLSLLGAYLVDVRNGDVKHIRDIPSPTAQEPRYERVTRVLRRYDKHLTQAEREFLTIFSAFRLPVDERLFTTLFQGVLPGELPRRKDTRTFLDIIIWKCQRFYQKLVDRLFPSQRRVDNRVKQQLNAALVDLHSKTFNAMIRRLVNYRILRHFPQVNYYTMHPLVSAYYFEQLNQGNGKQGKEIHQRIADYYLKIAGPIPDNPSLENLAIPIEAVYHLCRAGNYDEAFNVYWEHVELKTKYLLIEKLNAWDISLALMLELFPNGDTLQEPLVSSFAKKSWILNHIGLCLDHLGHLSEAEQFYQRYIEINLSKEDWTNACIGYENLASLYINLGQLNAGANATREALNLARRIKDKSKEKNVFADQAWIAHLQGNLEAASTGFQQAEVLHRGINPDDLYLYSGNGIYRADHLRRIGKAGYARQVTEANLETCKRNHWLHHISQCDRILGDLDADAGQHDSAREHYNEALKIARSISYRGVLIQALLARGRWAARRGDVVAARGDLDEALNYAVSDGDRISEADIRVALGWLYLAEGNYSATQVQAQRAKSMSAQMGYHWGQVDADEVLAALKQVNQSVLN